MPMWKLQGVEPDTCDPPGCRYIELWDSLSDPLTRTHTVVGYDRVCPAHTENVVTDKLLWEDGNWKDKAAFIQYQRNWFRHENHVRWLVENPGEQMPPQIASFTSDPVTSGSVAPPPQAEIDGMANAYAMTKTHNNWKNTIRSAAISVEGAGEDEVSWYWVGVGDSRVLHVVLPTLNNQQRNRLQSIADIQFGVGKIVVEA